MPANQSEIKTVLSNPAKILLAYMRCSGITDAKTLAADLDIPIRTIQRLKLECASCANDAISGASSDIEQNATCAKRAISGASDAAKDAISGAQPSCARANKELPSEVSSYLEVSKIPPTPQFEVPRVRFADGRLELGSELRQFWLTEFGSDAKRLDLALIEIGGRIQPHGSRPLEAQVSSQLARIAADKRDRDKRYQQATQANRQAMPDRKRLDLSKIQTYDCEPVL